MAIGAAVLGFNLLGDALRDALDPRVYYRETKETKEKEETTQSATQP
jgi:hypothetical protein